MKSNNLGKSYNGSDYDPGIWKFNSAGQLDSSFNGTGIVLSSPTGVDWNGIATDASGAVYITGTHSTGGRHDMTLWKYKPDGTLDTDFNGAGSVSHNAGAGTNSSASYAIKIDNTGKQRWIPYAVQSQ